jgi:exosortase/archaeosortase family protein
MSRLALSPRLIRTFMACAFLAAAVLFAQSRDALREVTRPIVLALLRLVGLQAEDHGENMSIAHLDVPWTRDCAGINLLIIMLALAVWVNRDESKVLTFWIRIALTFPAALLANVLRVLSLIAYRWIAFPAVESPQMHYFLGFFWMVPFIALITPKSQRPASHAWIETLHAAATVSLLTPVTGMPNGSMAAIAAIFALAQCRIREDFWRRRIVLSVIWGIAGAAVASMNMESFWLPWLLCCPLLIDFRWALSPAGFLVLLSTQSMFALQSWAPYIGWPAIGWAVWSWMGKSAQEPEIISDGRVEGFHRYRPVIFAAYSPLFFAPFLASSLLSWKQERWLPPATLESRLLENQGYEVILPEQPENIALLCYGPEGSDRHHTLKICLKYRGTELTVTTEDQEVFTDGSHWMRECFVQNGALTLDYPEYLKSTFAPKSSPGVHLIFISPKEAFSPREFSALAAKLAKEFHTHCVSHTPPLP